MARTRSTATTAIATRAARPVRRDFTGRLPARAAPAGSRAVGTGLDQICPVCRDTGGLNFRPRAAFNRVWHPSSRRRDSARSTAPASERRRSRRSTGSTSVERRRAVRPPRPERRRQDDDRQDPARADPRHRRDRAGLRAPGRRSRERRARRLSAGRAQDPELPDRASGAVDLRPHVGDGLGATRSADPRAPRARAPGRLGRRARQEVLEGHDPAPRASPARWSTPAGAAPRRADRRRRSGGPPRDPRPPARGSGERRARSC